MSNKKTTDTAVSTASEGISNAVSEPEYEIETLQKHCFKLFGVTTATFVGATTGIEAKKYTVKEIKSIIDEWCGKVVQ